MLELSVWIEDVFFVVYAHLSWLLIILLTYLGDFNLFYFFFFLAGELLSVAEHFLEQQMHPTVIIWAYRKALDDMISILKQIG